MFGLFSLGSGVSVGEAYARLGKPGALLLDVRTRVEVSDESIKGALNIPVDELDDAVDQLRLYETIDVICRSSARSLRAADLLHTHGLSQAESVRGGLVAWVAAGLPTAR